MLFWRRPRPLGAQSCRQTVILSFVPFDLFASQLLCVSAGIEIHFPCSQAPAPVVPSHLLYGDPLTRSRAVGQPPVSHTPPRRRLPCCAARHGVRDIATSVAGHNCTPACPDPSPATVHDTPQIPVAACSPLTSAPSLASIYRGRLRRCRLRPTTVVRRPLSTCSVTEPFGRRGVAHTRQQCMLTPLTCKTLSAGLSHFLTGR